MKMNGHGRKVHGFTLATTQRRKDFTTLKAELFRYSGIAKVLPNSVQNDEGVLRQAQNKLATGDQSSNVAGKINLQPDI